MEKFYHAITIIFLLFIISSCAPGSPPSESVTLYQVTITAEPEEAGSVSPTVVEVDEGEEIEITASPNENWIFDRWNGDHTGRTNPAKIIVNSDINISALFIKREFPLKVNIDGEGTVSERVIQPKTTDFPHGTTVELTANPSTGWIFSHWEGEVETDENPLEIVIDEAKEVTAVFIMREYDLEINIEGEGTVSEQVVDEENQTIQLTANPAEGWKFLEWRGDITGTENPVQLNLDNPKEVTAVFEKRDYPLTIHIEGEGTVSEEIIQARATEYPFGTTVELTASPADGWTFSHWEGDLTGSENPARIEINEEKKVTAVFEEEKEFYELNIETRGEGSVVTELESGETSDGLYENGAVVKLTASAADNWVFSHWEGSIDGDENPVSVEMNSDKAITAVFEKRDYPLTVNIKGEGTVTEEVVQQRTTDFPHGTTVQLTAKPANGWTFSHWEGDITGSENPVEIEITEATEVTAVFEKAFFNLTTQTDGSGSVTESLQSGDESGGEYEFESVVELTATPDDGWSFVRWDGDLDGSTNPQTITIDSDKSVTAVFEEDPDFFDLTIQTEGGGSVSVSLQSGNESGGSYQDGSTVELSAEPDDEWVFSHWEGDLDGDSSTQTITMDSDKTVTAVFEIREYPLTIHIEGEGTVSEEVIQARTTDYPSGTIVELTATAASGWSFVGWKGDLSGDENPVQIEISEATEVTAVFEELPPETFTIKTQTTGEGEITLDPDREEYEEGTEIEVEAVADDGWEFSHWEGDLTGSINPETITMDFDKSVTAVFEQETAFSGGDGSSGNPYQVSSINELQRVADYLDAHFIQINYIDASETASWNDGKGFDPIGDFESPFEGSYDGAGLEISGLTINRDEEQYVALFGLNNGATIKNTRVINVSIAGDEYVGGLVGIIFSAGFIEDCYVTGNVSGNSDVGGLAGRIVGTALSNSHAIVEVSGDVNVGGLVGVNGSLGGRIFDSYAEGNVSGNERVGGLVGTSSRQTTIQNSHATGTVTGTGDNIGGLVGHNEYASSIGSSFATGDVSGNDGVGGLVGSDNGGGTSGSYATGNVSGNDEVGGLFGQIRAPGGIRDSYATGNVTGVSILGGLVGNSSHLVHISRSFALGNVNGEDEVGGLIGINTNGRVSDTYAQGNVTGDESVGGLVGINDGDGEIATSYASGSVSGNSEVGGLIGSTSDEAIIESSYWDSEASGQEDGVGDGDSDGTTALSTSEMTGASAENNMPAFDWIEIWITTDGYPKFRWQG